MSEPKHSVYEKTRLRFTSYLLFGDIACVVASLVLGYLIRFRLFGGGDVYKTFPELSLFWAHLCVVFGVFVVVAHSQRLYRWSVVISRARSLSQILRTVVIWSFSVVGITLMLGLKPDFSRSFVVYATVCLFFGLALWRIFMHAVLHKSDLFAGVYRNVALIGTGPEAKQFADGIRRNRAGLHRFAGYIATGPERAPNLSDSEVIGEMRQLDELMASGRFKSVVVCDETIDSQGLIDIAKLCERNFVDFKSVPRAFEVFSSCLQIVPMGDLPVMSLVDLPQNRLVNRVTKRVFDFCGALAGLLVSIPFYLVLIPLIKRESPGPIFYKQVRVGQGGKHFEIYKIRSMKVDAEADGNVGWSTEIDPRRTKIGTFMRKWNIDEIPQFWNVLKGDMSLVGPRPERPELITGFLQEIPYYQSRHSVKPGMTGWAQVNGLRGDTSIAERIRYDLQYIENWSVWMDLSIQFRTIFNYKGAC